MMDANMPEMAENPKQEETPESIITNEPQMVEEIGEPDWQEMHQRIYLTYWVVMS